MMKKELELIDSLDQEVSRTVASYYIWKTIHKDATRDPMLRAALSETSMTWAHLLFSLQCSFFIQFERVFDGTSQHNIAKVADAVYAHAQENRAEACPSLQRLRRCISSCTDKAEPYRKIRRKAFAHPVLNDLCRIENLFKQTDVCTVERILEFLQRCVSSLRMYLLNGHSVNLRTQRIIYRDRVIADARRFLERLRVQQEF